MLQRIIRFSIENKLIIGLLVLGLVVWGAYSASRLPIDAVPDITNNQVQIITVSPALGAGDIERLITFPIEQATRNIPGIIEQRSFSRFGLSLVTIVFDDATDVYWARQQVNERLQTVRNEIPDGSGNPELAPVTTGLGEIFQYVVRAKPGYEGRYSELDLRTIQDWIIRRQLLGTPGVADVSSFGGKVKQYEVAIDPNRLRSYGVSLETVFEALHANNQNAGGSYIEKGPNALFIRTEGLVQSKAQIAGIPVKRLSDGSSLKIGDLGEVRLGHATRFGALSYNDEGEVAGAVVMMLKGENSSAVIKAVKDRIREIETTLPEGVTIEPFLDRTKMVNNAISTVERNLLEGALIVLFILVIFLGNLRAGLLVASVIPLSLLFAIILMNAFGVSGNLMSLGALDFGLIVDGAVIIVEAVLHRLHHGKHFRGHGMVTRSEMNEEVGTAAGKLMNAAVFGQIIILVVYLPILSLESIEGKMFKPMAQTVAFAILGAFLLSLTYIPMMSSLILSRKIRTKPNLADRILRRLEHWHETAMNRVLKKPISVLLLAILLFGGSISVLASLGGEFIPELEEGDFAVDTRVLTGSSLSTSVAAVQQAAGLLKQRYPEVEKVVTKTGSGEIPTDPMPIEASDMMVILKDKQHWTSAKSFDELAEKMSTTLQEIPGISVGFQFPVQMRFNELMTGGRQDVVCKIFGDNLDSLARYATLLGEEVRQVPGAVDLYVEAVTGLPQLVVRYRREALLSYGLRVDEVNQAVQTAFAGASAGMLFEDDRRFDLVVRLNDNARTDLQDLRELPVLLHDGSPIPLSQLADVNLEVGPNQIQRENARRRITVGFNVRGRDVQSIVEELKERVRTKLDLPSGYSITYGGQFENLIAAKARLAIAVPIALGLILLLLYFAFGSIRQSVLVFSAIPLSAIGGIVALWLRGMPFSISAGIGFIALFGVAVLNGIVLVTEFNLLKKSGVNSIKERIVKGTRIRLRPVLMTAAVASLGFLPMALSKGAGAEVQRPLATVVIGGLVSATLLTLLVLPVLYQFSEEHLENRRLRKALPTVLLLLFCLGATNLTAQQTEPATPIGLKAAIDSALKNNSGIQAQRKNLEAADELSGNAYELSPTEFGYESGKINSPYEDRRFGVQQRFSSPVYYANKRRYFRYQVSVAEQETNLYAMRLRKEVRQVFTDYRMAEATLALLKRTDSLFAKAAALEELRHRSGDNDPLQVLSVRSRREELRGEVLKSERDLTILAARFRELLGTTTNLLPSDAAGWEADLGLPDTDAQAHGTHSLLQLASWRERSAWARWKLEQASMGPDFTLGVVSQSFSGFQRLPEGEVLLGKNDRYQSVQIGIGIPLFYWGARARVKSAKANWAQAGFLQEAEQIRLRRERLERQERLQAAGEQYSIYRDQTLPLISELERKAALRLSSGDIRYFEWLSIVEQCLRTRHAALESYRAYLHAIIDWNELSEQN